MKTRAVCSTAERQCCKLALVLSVCCRCVKVLPNVHLAKSNQRFYCPHHYCAACSQSGNGRDMGKCMRCTRAYHAKCLPKESVRLVTPLKVRAPVPALHRGALDHRCSLMERVLRAQRNPAPA